MTRIDFVSPNGATDSITATSGRSLMDTAVQNGVAGIVGECGGAASCSTCHVYLDDTNGRELPPMTELEDEMLDGAVAERRAVSRLSCQIPVHPSLDGLEVHIPEKQQ
ncbi:MAG: 2Fe-2S iron-sulfur cluster-binding protein [Rhodococcus sp. (in: high G+C Gram-positive bacteria)]|uniref:2Fe-2S iron-sulfur cluster-binding protein n=1 Tax=Rhodococcus sp. TaxID=1831 RepID=UPI003BB19D18